MSDPVAHEQAVVRLFRCIRPWLGPPDRQQAPAQQRAFELADQAACAIGAVWREVHIDGTLVPRAERDAVARGDAAFTMAHAIAQEIYFASGAMGRNHAADATPEPRQFARNALPVLAKLARVSHPAVTHSVVETLAYLMETSGLTEQCYALAADAILPGTTYENEQLAVTAVLAMYDRFVADHRDLLLESPTCLSATRRMLGAFVRAGWDAAIARAQEFGTEFALGNDHRP
jgi:hypothetical protein